MIHETSVVTAFGQRGTGKSTCIRRLSSLFQKRIVIDRLREWKPEGIRHSERFAIVKSFAAFEAWIQNNLQAETFTLVIQFEPFESDDSRSDFFNAVLRFFYTYGSETLENFCIVIEEVDMYASSAYIEPMLKECLITGRHANLAIMAATTRPSHCHKLLISSSDHVFIGRLFESRDIDYFKSAIGDVAERARGLPDFTFIHFQSRHPEATETITL